MIALSSTILSLPSGFERDDKLYDAFMKRLLAFILIICLTAGCAHNPDRGKIETPSPEELTKEFEAGKNIHRQITTYSRIYTEPRVAGYVSRVGRTVARKAERQDLHYLFTILYDDRVYATSAPGGFVYVTTGFMNFIESESELAAVLASEIAQLQYADPQYSKKRKVIIGMTNAGAIAAPFLGPFGGLVAGALVLTSALAQNQLDDPGKRLNRADRATLGYLQRAGYDPQGFLELLYRLEEVPVNSKLYDYFSHYKAARPVTPARLEKLNTYFSKLPLEKGHYDVHRGRYLMLTKGVREIFLQ